MDRSSSFPTRVGIACSFTIAVCAAIAVARATVMRPMFAPAWTGSSSVASGFGHSVASAGDVNGDGFDDVVIGAPWYDGGQFWEGKAFTYHGSATGMSPTPNWSVEHDVAHSWLGSDVAGVGDVDGDGYDDVVIGTERYSNGQTFEGRAELFRGSPTGLAAVASWIVESNEAGAHYGAVVAAAGDVNNDGFCDVLVGAAQSSPYGKAFVYHGGPTGLPAVASTLLVGPNVNAYFATDAQSAGDVNGDGFDDVVVGCPGYSNGQTYEGGAFVFAGSATGLVPTPLWSTESNVVNGVHGSVVSDGGDFNGDGYSDFAIGAPTHAVVFEEGRAEAFFGSASGPGAAPSWSHVADDPGTLFATSLANAGDVDGDGYDDLLVGAPHADDQPLNFAAGRMFVFLGGANGLEAIPSWSGGHQANAMFLGLSVAGAGDVNGDGFDDVIGGGENFDSGAQRAQIFHGGAFASIAAYGPSKAVTTPSVHAPRLVSTVPPSIGTTANLVVVGGVKSAGGGFLFAGFQPANIPFDEGTLNVVPTYVVLLPAFDAQGKVTIPVAIPALAGLDGLSVYFQAGQGTFLASGPHHTTQTNGLRWVLGN